MSRVGVFAGTFDPVHQGHIEFALAAADEAKLDQVYFLPERQPRGKGQVTEYEHRQKMLQIALKSYPNLGVLDFSEDRFTVAETLLKLQDKFQRSRIYLILGSDAARNVNDWEDAEELLNSVKLVVGLRGSDDEAGGLPADAVVIKSPQPEVSAGKIRAGKMPGAVDPAVQDYINRSSLYK